MTIGHDLEFQGSFFGFSIDGVEIGLFTKVGGLSLEFNSTEFSTMTGTGSKITIKRPGRAKYTPISLSRGFAPDKKLYDWFDEVVKAAKPVVRKTGAIIVYDRTHAEVARFNIDKCWPSKLSIDELAAGSDAVLIESVTIEHEFLDWV